MQMIILICEILFMQMIILIWEIQAILISEISVTYVDNWQFKFGETSIVIYANNFIST